MMKLRDPFKKTKQSILFLNIGQVLISLIIFALTISIIFSSTIRDMNNQQLRDQMDFFLNNPLPPIREPGKRPVAVEMFLMVPPMSGNIMVLLYQDGKLLGKKADPYFSDEQMPELPLDTEGEIFAFTQDGSFYRGIGMTDLEYSIQLIINVDSEVRSRKALDKTLFLGLLLLILLTTVSSKLLSERIIVPVKNAYENQVQFVQDASHEMRTPLAVIKGALELLIRKQTDPIEKHQLQVSQMLSEIYTLEKMNTNLLMLSKEDSATEIYLEKINLKEFLNQISLYYQELSELQNKQFVLNLFDEEVFVHWDSNKMKRALNIILENAFKYTKAGDTITFTCEIENQKVLIRIADTGIGIAEEEITKVFERFYRSPRIRGLNIDGSGIGLSLLQAIGRTLNFKLQLSSKLGEGTVIELHIHV